MPKVSIIMPVYNSEKYLGSALESVLSQDFKDLEIICVNDGSTDSSAKILEQYQADDDRIRIISQKNSGGSAARNNGISHARGGYIMFLDSDDQYAKGVVSCAYDRAIETGADIVFYKFARFVGKPTVLASIDRVTPQVIKEIYTKDNNSERYFNDFAILTWNKLIRASLLKSGGVSFNTKLSHDHDVDFSIRLMLAADTLSYVERVGYYYRVDSAQSLTSTKHKDPANVLRIVASLAVIINTQFPELKQSFDNYVVDMVIGAISRQQQYPSSQEEVFNFAMRRTIPYFKFAHKPDGYFYKPAQLDRMKVVMEGDYRTFVSQEESIKKKIRLYLNQIHRALQEVLALFRV